MTYTTGTSSSFPPCSTSTSRLSPSREARHHNLQELDRGTSERIDLRTGPAAAIIVPVHPLALVLHEQPTQHAGNHPGQRLVQPRRAGIVGRTDPIGHVLQRRSEGGTGAQDGAGGHGPVAPNVGEVARAGAVGAGLDPVPQELGPTDRRPLLPPVDQRSHLRRNLCVGGRPTLLTLTVRAGVEAGGRGVQIAAGHFAFLVQIVKELKRRGTFGGDGIALTCLQHDGKDQIRVDPTVLYY